MVKREDGSILVINYEDCNQLNWGPTGSVLINSSTSSKNPSSDDEDGGSKSSGIVSQRIMKCNFGGGLSSGHDGPSNFFDSQEDGESRCSGSSSEASS